MKLNYPIYLDYHATTPVDRQVADRIYHYMIEEFGNAIQQALTRFSPVSQGQKAH